MDGRQSQAVRKIGLSDRQIKLSVLRVSDCLEPSAKLDKEMSHASGCRSALRHSRSAPGIWMRRSTFRARGLRVTVDRNCVASAIVQVPQAGNVRCVALCSRPLYRLRRRLEGSHQIIGMILYREIVNRASLFLSFRSRFNEYNRLCKFPPLQTTRRQVLKLPKRF
jgi:hypothetical protein